MSDRGRSRGRGRGRGGRHDSATSKECFEFKKTGNCTRANCKFRHGDASNDTRRVRTPPTEEEKQARTNYNAWKKFLGPGYAPSDPYIMTRVWNGALAILEEDDRDLRQQLSRDLDASEQKCNGRAHIKAVVEMQSSSTDAKTLIHTSVAFLNVISHSSVLDCLAVDTYVGGIYSFVSGVNGIRAFAFFEQLCKLLVHAKTDSGNSIDGNMLTNGLIALTKTLIELLKRDQRARFNNSLDSLIDSLRSAAQTISTGTTSIESITIKKHLRGIQGMLNRAKGLTAAPNDLDGDETTARQTHTYPRDLTMPQDRHDNDKLDIAEIRIFPTRDEILCDTPEFLPSTDPDQLHFLTDQVERHIDTNFRLFRHDIFGDLKVALAELMQSVSKDPAVLVRSKFNLGNVRAHHYSCARVFHIGFDKRRGLEAQVSFPQPPSVRNMSLAAQQKWWEESRRLQQGSLLSFIWLEDSEVKHLFLTATQKFAKQDNEGDGSNMRATAAVKLVTKEYESLQALLHLSIRRTQGVLLEYPNVVPATFVPVLENLQNMQRLSRLPFSDWILPDRHDQPANVDVYQKISPPLYARRPGFKFPLKAILKSDVGSFDIKPTASCDDVALIEEIASKTNLDSGQGKALVAALTREFAFIQGPPGTGKSYVGLQIMKVLLAIKKTTDLGPIIVVCYTNHALDQFLEHLIEIGIDKIIRIGGQSKSELLDGCNLRKVAQGGRSTRNESSQLAQTYAALEELEKEAKEELSRLHGIARQPQWGNLERHLDARYPRIYAQFRDIDDEGFQHSGRKPFDIWASQDLPGAGRSAVPDIELLLEKASDNIHSLDSNERSAVIRHWVKEVCFHKITSIFTTVDDATENQETRNRVYDEADRRVLQGADVIGVTTTGLAKRIAVLQHIQCKVIICEESGEVMEPHMISALLPTVEHCIQIGDHEQLRPTINNFTDLSLESKRGATYQLDRSQFERLSVGGNGRLVMPVAQLEVQRRMRPDISTLIRETIYPRLVDHATTVEMPDVVGLRKNLFWFDHRKLEDHGNDFHNKSRSNSWEVTMVHAFVRHVVRQGVYKSKDIAVLTPYTGQLQKLRQSMCKDFEIILSDRDEDALEKDGFTVEDGKLKAKDGTKEKPKQETCRKPLQKKQLSDLLRIATVDNFQGEEAKIIIVSLVRSNEARKVGFLKTSNRINVLLSRAKHGMYLIGNTETYSLVPMWNKVINILQTSDAVGDSLGLCCPRHKDKVIEVREPDDFLQYSPEGGCREACNERLADCGHQCQARCHSKAMHDIFKCEKPCQRRHKPCDHRCEQATCGEDCGKCTVKILNVKLPCGHIKDEVECHRTLNLSTVPCTVIIEKAVPGCGHFIHTTCSQGVESESFKCPTPCKGILACGHSCPGACGHCNGKDKDGHVVVKHVPCIKKCGRKFGTCNHNCSRPCHSGTDCGLCENPCEIRCKHSRCAAKCNEPCAPCVEKCVWSCEHQGACTMPCAAPCNRLPCNERCSKILPCGHQCSSICNEECPVEYCQTCNMKSEEVVDVLEGKTFSEIDLNEQPIIVLGCGHFFTTETLDGTIGLPSVYEVDTKTGDFVGLANNADHMIPKCPTCARPIRQHATQRYNRLINKAVIDEMSKRFIVNGEHGLRQLEEQTKIYEGYLEKTCKDLVPSRSVQNGDIQSAERARGHASMLLSMLQEKIDMRYNDTIMLMKLIKAFQQQTSAQNQPANKLHEAIMHAELATTNIEDDMARLGLDTPMKAMSPKFDQRVALGGHLLGLKVRCLVLEDQLSIDRAAKAMMPGEENKLKFQGVTLIAQVQALLKSCRKFVGECVDASLPKLAVEATLYHARITYNYQSTNFKTDADRIVAQEHCDTAKHLLQQASELCKRPFKDSKSLAQAVAKSQKLLAQDFYEEVSQDEIDAIKLAMVSGPDGINTHSGHWYNCENGHPFAINNCGMPMEEARCYECGAPIGGRDHVAVEGVTRAVEME